MEWLDNLFKEFDSAYEGYQESVNIGEWSEAAVSQAYLLGMVAAMKIIYGSSSKYEKYLTRIDYRARLAAGDTGN